MAESESYVTAMRHMVRRHLQRMEPDALEHFVAEVWERFGWETRVVGEPGDRGIDVLATATTDAGPQKQLIQAKRYGPNTTVGSPEVQHDPHLDDVDIPDRPVLFIKTPNALSGHRDTVTVPDHMPVIDFEGELGVVIGEQSKNLSEDEALQYVEGYTCVNDLSNHEELGEEEALVRVKSFDNSGPVGPVVADKDSVPDDASIQLRTNGTVRQNASIDDMIFSVPEILVEITKYLTLEPGDIVATGSPAGTDELNDGDSVAVEIEGIGTLKHEIRWE